MNILSTKVHVESIPAGFEITKTNPKVLPAYNPEESSRHVKVLSKNYKFLYGVISLHFTSAPLEHFYFAIVMFLFICGHS
jgi:hypothetical protein